MRRFSLCSAVACVYMLRSFWSFHHWLETFWEIFKNTLFYSYFRRHIVNCNACLDNYVRQAIYIALTLIIIITIINIELAVRPSSNCKPIDLQRWPQWPTYVLQDSCPFEKEIDRPYNMFHFNQAWPAVHGRNITRMGAGWGTICVAYIYLLIGEWQYFYSNTNLRNVVWGYNGRRRCTGYEYEAYSNNICHCRCMLRTSKCVHLLDYF